MLEKILDYERELFFMLNGSDSIFWDHFMWLYSGKVVWLPLGFFILIVLTYKINWRESIMVLLAIVLVVTLCDQFSSHIFKPLFMRFRPTHHPEFMAQVETVFGYRGGKYGFISSHAANAFGFAMYMTLLFRHKPLFTCTIFFWAIVTAYTRIYLGVHFISDIIPGMLLGIFIGYVVYVIYERTRKWILGRGGVEVIPTSEIYSLTRQRLIVGGIVVTIIVITILNGWLVHVLR